MEDLRNRKIAAGKTSRYIKFLKNLQFETGKSSKVLFIACTVCSAIKKWRLANQDNS